MGLDQYLQKVGNILLEKMSKINIGQKRILQIINLEDFAFELTNL